MNIWLMIVVCSIVTLVPRMAPYFMPFLAKLPKKIQKCMILLPVAALGALIFPLALTDFSNQWYAGLVSYFKAPMIVAIICALVLTAGVLCI